MEKINYYVIQTQENREYSVVSDLKARGFRSSDYHILVPTEEVVVAIGSRKFIYKSRAMPDYVLLGAEDLTARDINKICSIKGVESVVMDSTTTGFIPAKLETAEVKKIVKNYHKSLVFDDPNVNVLFGKYAGYSGKIIIQNGDEVVLTINIKTNPKVKMPVWYLGTEIGE